MEILKLNHLVGSGLRSSGLTILTAATLRLQAADTTAGLISQESGMPAHRVWLTFGLDGVPGLRLELVGNPLWQYLAFLIYGVLAFSFSRALDRIAQVQLRKWVAKTGSKPNSLVFDLLKGPVKIVAFVVLLHIGLRLFDWPEWASNLISNGLKIIVACSLTYIAIKFVELSLALWHQRAEAAQEGLLDRQLFPIIRKTLKIFVIAVAVLVTSQNLGMNVTGLLASLSIGGLAVGLAAQDMLSNLFGAVAILADQPFRVGDRIQLEKLDGTVEGIGLRSTRVRNLDGHVVTVPNKTMASASIVNVSMRPNIKTLINIGLTYDTPSCRVERAVTIIEEIFRSHPKTFDLLVSFNKFESSSLNIQVAHWWDSTDSKEYLLGIQGLNLELKRRFEAEGIGFAFPTQTVHLRQETEPATCRQKSRDDFKSSTATSDRTLPMEDGQILSESELAPTSPEKTKLAHLG